MSLDADEFFELIEVAIQKEKEDRLHRQWCSMLPFMSLKQLEYVSFKEYIDKCDGKNIDMRSNEEIIDEIMETHRKAKMKRGEM